MEEETTLKAKYEGDLKIGDITIKCAVLEDGTRVIWQRSLLSALGRSSKPSGGKTISADNIPPFLAPNNLKPFIDADLLRATTPILFKGLKSGGLGGNIAYGYEATILPRICEVYLKANDANALYPSQKHIAKRSEILIRGLANVGIIALVDEATGYQKDREELLQKILEKYISKELIKWQKIFPDEFYKEIFRLNRWQWRGRQFNPPQVVGRYTNNIIYERLHPDLREQLEKSNPTIKPGIRKHKHTQWMTQDFGHPLLKNHIIGIIALMKASSNWRNFMSLVNRVYPLGGVQQELDFGKEFGEPDY